MKHETGHRANLNALKRINGQVEGLQRMIEDERCCSDIIIQINAAIHALYRVGDKMIAKHIENCLKDVFTAEPKREMSGKIDEIMKVTKIRHKFSGN